LDDTMRDLVAHLGVSDGKPAPAVLAALQDRQPVRRAAAAVAVLRSGSGEHLAQGRKLLQDTDPMVRFHVARVLVDRNDKVAVPVLIALLAELPMEQAWDVEELLTRLAGEKAPVAALSADPAQRAACRDQWTAWWRDNAGAVNLALAQDET